MFGYSSDDAIGIKGYATDPLHLNDVEVAHKESSSYKKGDLFLSIRHRSAIVQYRPSKNEVVRVIDGPFLGQHDADFISGDEISVFNNNVSTFGNYAQDNLYASTTNDSDTIEFFPSNIVKYNLANGQHSVFAPNIFEEEKIHTFTEGLHEFLSNGDVFVESQNEGKIYVLNEQEVKLRKYFKTEIEGMAHQGRWIRVYENIDFLKQ